MLAMLRKDLYVMGRTVAAYAAVWTVIAGMLAWIPDRRSDSLYYIMPVMSATAVLYSLDADERCHWDRFAAVTPLTPRQIVLAKYLLGYCVTVLITVLGVLAGWVSTLGKGGLRMWDIPAVMVFFIATALPLIYRFGRKTGTLFLMMFWGVMMAVALTLRPGFNPIYAVLKWGRTAPRPLVAVIIIAALAAVNAASIRFSVRFYTSRRMGWYEDGESI